MEFFVYSRRAMEAVAPHELPHIVISITSGPEDVARLRSNERCKGVLRLGGKCRPNMGVYRLLLDHRPKIRAISAAGVTSSWS